MRDEMADETAAKLPKRASPTRLLYRIHKKNASIPHHRRLRILVFY